MTPLKPFFSYYGGKWRAARHYPAPVFPTIVEPFAGSAGYSHLYPDRQIVLYDVDPHIVGVWRFLISASTADILALPVDVTDGIPASLPQEARWLIGWWLDKGATYPRKKRSSWMRSGEHDTSFWGAAKRARIAAQVDRIRHWRVFELPYWYAVPGDCTWFVDPPY